jgi:membrane protease YdiL (CAAX protease family)
MTYRSAKGFSGLAQLGILFALIGAGLILAAISQFIIGLSLVDASLPLQQQAEGMVKALLKPENAFYLQLSQVVGTLFLMFLPAMGYMWICHGRNTLWLGFSKHINIWQVVLGFLLIFCANLVAGPVADVSKQIVAHFPNLDKLAKSLDDTYNEQVLAMSNLKSWKAFFIAIAIMAFFPALFEEMVFRGALQNLFVRWWKQPAIAIAFTALLFSFIHGSIYLFLSRAVLGFVLGWMYYKSKNLWVNIMAHFLNNTLVVIQLFVISRSSEKIDMSKLDERMPLAVELASIAVLYALFVLFNKVSAKNRAAVETDEQKLWIASTPKYGLANNQN